MDQSSQKVFFSQGLSFIQMCYTPPHANITYRTSSVSASVAQPYMNENICHHQHHFCGCTPHIHGGKVTMLTKCVWWYWELPGRLSLVVKLWAWIQFCEQCSHINHLSPIPALNYSFICLEKLTIGWFLRGSCIKKTSRIPFSILACCIEPINTDKATVSDNLDLVWVQFYKPCRTNFKRVIIRQSKIKSVKVSLKVKVSI